MTLLLSANALAQPAPFHHYRTLETTHFRITVPKGLEQEGRVAGAAAERAYALLSKDLKPPRGTIDLVVTDDADYSNGYATPTPTSRIVVHATPPIESSALRLNEDWLQLVITHELTHIFHLDRVGGVWSVAQHIFGRGPALFPAAYGPSWFTEGLAVYYESKLTRGGRLKDAEHRLLARAAAQDHEFPGLGDLSLGTPLFPGGERAYGFGSLLVEEIANSCHPGRSEGSAPAACVCRPERSEGSAPGSGGSACVCRPERSEGPACETGISRFIDNQTRALIPTWYDKQARAAFGISFTDAFTHWRDSLLKEFKAPIPPIEGWRELTHHAFYAQDPRWLNDSTVIYAANDGRNTSATYQLHLDGRRDRLGRRNSLGPTVRLPDGGFLFAQLEFETSDIVRSDLYVEHDDRQSRLTHGMRLVQPDVRSDGVIVATQIEPTRTRLVLLDSVGHFRRVLRDASSDETWSEPRWSPDGAKLAVIHRTHGGSFTLESIDLASNIATTLDRCSCVLATPAWASDSRSIVYTSEATDIPLLSRATIDSGLVFSPRRDNGSTGVFTPEPSPLGDRFVIGSLRSDGYHLGLVDRSALSLTPRSPDLPDLAAEPAAEVQVLATGDYHDYAVHQSVMPTYWYPVIEAAPGGATRFGASTAGHDLVFRHIYDGYYAVPTNGFYPTGRFTYRYAGLRAPYIDFQVTQDYTSDGTLTNGGTAGVVGDLLRRTRTASLSATFVRPRVRTYHSLSFGAAIESRDWRSDPPQFLKQLDTAYARSYNFPSAFVSAGFSNTQRPSLSISPEDGISISATARQRLRADLASTTRSSSIVGATSLYKSLDLPGFAHHVLALRMAAGWADKNSASSFVIGGVSGNTLELVPGYNVGQGRRTFPLRGFPDATTYGTQAVGGSLEYRAPITVSGKGFGNLPFFFDRSSFTAFADAGRATCASNPLVIGVCAPASRLGQTFASVGGELVQSATILDFDQTQTLRFGFAVPVVGKNLVSVSAVSVYLAYGISY